MVMEIKWKVHASGKMFSFAWCFVFVKFESLIVHVFQVSSLKELMTNQKTSNFALSQELEAAKEKIDEFLVEKENLQNQLERTAYAHAEEKIKLESTLQQQTKLIDFLNAKVVEEAPKGKKGKVCGYSLFYECQTDIH